MTNNYQYASYKCNICNKPSYQPINLKCNHHPCYNCIQSYVKLDTTSKLQKKYHISCPTCNKKTVFYDVRHLIMTKNQCEDQETFVTNKFINKPQTKFNSKQQNNYIQTESQLNTKRGSIQSVANISKVCVETKCIQHKEIYRYFCCDCYKLQLPNDFVLCNICAKSHYNQGHRLISLKHAEKQILDYNIMQKQQISQKYEEINIFAHHSAKTRESTQQNFKKIQEALSKQYKNLFQKLNKKYLEMKQQLRQSYEASIQMIDKNIDEIVNCKQVLSDLRALELKNMESNLKFYQNCNHFKLNFTEIHKINIKQLPLINKIVPHFQALLEAISYLKFDDNKPVKTSDHKRKYSQQECQLTNRSCSQKQNKKMVDSNQSKVLFKKLFA